MWRLKRGLHGFTAGCKRLRADQWARAHHSRACGDAFSAWCDVVFDNGTGATHTYNDDYHVNPLTRSTGGCIETPQIQTNMFTSICVCLCCECACVYGDGCMFAVTKLWTAVAPPPQPTPAPGSPAPKGRHIEVDGVR